ncbi:MAG: hypothetical protein FWE42_03855 [Defluviitaleaceae bacterium]|nr:hypothetical protein [Defluviitaleaceae bacterium]
MGTINKKCEAHTEFILETPQEYRDFVSQAHEFLAKAGYKPKFQIRKYGFTAQYNSPVTKRLALQFFIRENTLHMYLYSGFFYNYCDFFDVLPARVIKNLEANNNCRNCSTECAKNKCIINGRQYEKCLCGRALFVVDDEVAEILHVLQKICELGV